MKRNTIKASRYSEQQLSVLKNAAIVKRNIAQTVSINIKRMFGLQR